MKLLKYPFDIALANSRNRCATGVRCASKIYSIVSVEARDDHGLAGNFVWNSWCGCIIERDEGLIIWSNRDRPAHIHDCGGNTGRNRISCRPDTQSSCNENGSNLGTALPNKESRFQFVHTDFRPSLLFEEEESMGDGMNVTRAPQQAPVHDAGVIEDAKPKDTNIETKADAQPAVQPKDKPVADSSTKKQEQTLKGTQRQAELNRQLENKTQPGESLKAAQKIMDNPRLSNEAKIAELQKVIEKTDKNEFGTFMKKYPNFSMDQKALIHSAMMESPKIMERVASELNQSEQLTVIWNAVEHSTHGSNPKDEAKRQARADKGIAAWMQKTDTDTLNKALDGKSTDFKASAKLYGTLVSDPARLIMNMGAHQGKLMGDQLVIAQDLMNAAYNNQGRDVSRQDIENMAASLIAHQITEEMKKNAHRNPDGR
jgi:hypothetical protein